MPAVLRAVEKRTKQPGLPTKNQKQNDHCHFKRAKERGGKMAAGGRKGTKRKPWKVLILVLKRDNFLNPSRKERVEYMGEWLELIVNMT